VRGKEQTRHALEFLFIAFKMQKINKRAADPTPPDGEEQDGYPRKCRGLSADATTSSFNYGKTLVLSSLDLKPKGVPGVRLRGMLEGVSSGCA
jgi:hypothetical protein